MADIERRIIGAEDIELRVEKEDGKPAHIKGYAARFNKKSVDMGFVETIAPGAFKDALKDADVRALKNHNPDLLLGRSTAGTLELQENKLGLKFDAEAPDTTTGRDTVEEIRRGDISGCSFSFTVAEDGDEWVEKDGNYFRTVTKVGILFDVGPVTYPAYPDTTVAARSLEAFKAEQRDVEPEPEPEPSPEPTSEPEPEPEPEPPEDPEAEEREEPEPGAKPNMDETGERLARAEEALKVEALATIKTKIGA